MITVLFDITKKCNLSCRHCYNSKYIGKNDDTNHLLVNKFLSLNYDQIERIHILGGEPFCYEKLFDFIAAVPDNIKISINTNGTFLSPSIVDNISKFHNIDQITISIDGHDSFSNDLIRGQNAFIKTMSKLPLLSSMENVKKNLAFVVTTSNFKSISKLGSIAKLYDFDNIFISFLYREGNARNNESILDDNTKEQIASEIAELINKSSPSLKVVVDSKQYLSAYISSKIMGNVEYLSNTFNGCRGGKEIIFISQDKKVYPCGPCEKYGDKFMIMDLKKECVKLNLEKISYLFCNNGACFPDIHYDVNDMELYSKRKILKEINDFNFTKIHIKEYQQIVNYNKNVFLIDFINNNIYKLPFLSTLDIQNVNNDNTYIDKLDLLGKYSFLALAKKGVLDTKD